MRKILTVAICSLPLAMAPAVYAQSTAPSTGAAPDTSAPAPAPNPAPAPAPGAGTGAGAGTGGAAMPSTGGAGAGAMAADEKVETISGWSVKDKIIGSTVVNEADEKIGNISDVVLAADGKAAHVIVGAGGFLGLGEHDVAIPYDEIKQNGDKWVLAGYTKDQLKALPKVEVTE